MDSHGYIFSEIRIPLPSSVRPSGSKRQLNQNYSTDELQGPHGFSSDSEDENVSENDETAVDDDEFANEQEDHIPEEDDTDQDEVSDGDRNASPADEGDADDPEVDESPPGPVIGRRSINQATVNGLNLRYKLKSRKPLKDIVRSKGLVEPLSKNPSKEAMLKFMAGGHPQDWVDFLRTKEQWVSDPTLPRRKEYGKGKGAMCHHFSHTEDNRKMEATVGWDWYYDQGGRELLTKRQKTQILTPDDGLAYIPKPSEQSHKCLMGPYGNQKVFDLPTGLSMCLNDAWKPTNQEGTEPGKIREGWMLNLGTSIKCLDWATNQDGEVQYLAAATAQPKVSLSQGLSEVSPAFTPSAPLRSCIQIWAFAAKQAPDHESLLDSRQPPAVQRLICTEWGEVKQLKWCQIPRKFRDVDFVNKIPIGLLAGVWSDGVVRVLDVHLEKNEERTVNYVKYDEPAFKAWAPNTLCTCVTWLSATTLAVGFANGFLAIWDISEATTPETQPSASSCPPTPWLYTPLHQSYILALTSAYPNSPHLISTSSIDGYARLTDIRSPTTDYAMSIRSRSASPLLSFSPSLLSILSTEENDFARIFPLRSFHSSVCFARAPGSPLCLAPNYFHPCVLMGCADGSLIATNPLPRVWNRKWPYYQQVVFRHEWTQGKPGGTLSNTGGISRITESYKVVQAGTFRALKLPSSSSSNPPTNSARKRKSSNTTQDPKDKQFFATIHEEKSGITQVVWNPNLKCGGWMAAGMGSGFVRVQDLAV